MACIGKISSISNIYANDVKIDDMSNITIYLGSEDQKPNSTMQRYLGIDTTPAFRGIAYVTFDTFCLDDYNGNIPNFTFDINNTEHVHSFQNLFIIGSQAGLTYKI